MLKKFIMKQALKFKGVPTDQAEAIAEKLEKNPELMQAMKALESNKEVKELLEKIQKETDEKVKGGMDATMAQMSIMMKYKHEFAKHRDVLEPLMMLMQR